MPLTGLKRFNKMIELLDHGQPVYNILAKDVSYEGGKAMAHTWADYIKVDMEHAPFDIRALDQFMRGLVDGGPTKSGHRIPAVVAEVPAEGVSAEEIRANAWMFKQVLARGVTGINLCHAETPAAIKAFVEACRYPFHTIGVGDPPGPHHHSLIGPCEPGGSGTALAEGRRGHGNAGEEDAAAIWGHVGPRVPATCRRVASQPQRRVDAGGEDREPTGATERRTERAGARYRLCRVGFSGYGLVARVCRLR